jgi:hypothetical protein
MVTVMENSEDELLKKTDKEMGSRKRQVERMETWSNGCDTGSIITLQVYH